MNDHDDIGVFRAWMLTFFVELDLGLLVWVAYRFTTLMRAFLP